MTEIIVKLFHCLVVLY